MKTAIIAYDLKDVTPYQNSLVKTRLLEFTNTTDTLSGRDTESNIPRWVTLNLPDTTILADVQDHETSEALAKEVEKIIRKLGANPGKIFVAFIAPDVFLLNLD
ncbi:MAG: hypothetical protein KF712_09810 [Akkermansiaceae bacterium]|nr:hypothetical protein [Akkermansiaceae bacterium]